MASNPADPVTAEIIDLRTEKLFLRMSAIYGYRWLNIYRNEEYLKFTKCEWAASLKRFDNRVLKEVLLNFRDKQMNPPNLPEFLDACIATQKRLSPFSVSLEPFQRGDEAIAKSNIQAMYEKLGR